MIIIKNAEHTVATTGHQTVECDIQGSNNNAGNKRNPRYANAVSLHKEAHAQLTTFTKPVKGAHRAKEN